MSMRSESGGKIREVLCRGDHIRVEALVEEKNFQTSLHPQITPITFLRNLWMKVLNFDSCLEIFNSPLQTIAQRNRRVPTERRLRARDVGLALARIVGG